MQRTAVVLAGAIAVGSFASGDSTRLFQRKVYEASGSRTCSPTDHGASPSLSDNAAAIQSALRECQGGGTVVLEGGEFKSGPLTVSGVNVTFEVADGASLRMAFPPLASSQQKEAEGASVWPSSSGDYIDVLVFDQCYGCTLTGQGLLHGGGIADQWYYLFDQGKLKLNRPHYLAVNNCADFLLSGKLTLLDAPMFNVVINNSTRSEIFGLNITSTWYTEPQSGDLKEPHNTDGIDPGSGSSLVHVHDVYIHNGDDSIAVKPSSTCTRDILIENSHFEYGHGCSIGSVGKGCVENVLFRNITMSNQQNGCRVKTYSTDVDGTVRNITWENITMADSGNCVTVNANYKPAPSHATHFVSVSDLTFRDIVGTGCQKYPASFVCPDAAPCEDIVLDNVQLSGGEDKMQCENAFGASTGTVVPHSCLSGGHGPKPAPGPAHAPSPAPATCDVAGCFKRCVAKYGGTITTDSYSCAKGCAGMKDQKEEDPDKFCKIPASKRFDECETYCSGSSHDPANVAQCKYGCQYWEQ